MRLAASSNVEAEQTVLVIDDTPDVIRLVSGILKEHYRVKVATSGERGLEVAASSPPDLVLLDVVMPEVDGYETCRRLKAQAETRDIPVIFLTARLQDDDESLGLSIGAADYIKKPITPSILLARVGTQLRLKHATDLLRDQNRLLEAAVAERTRELRETNEALARFVPNQFLAQLGRSNIRDVEIGHHVHSDMTVMFCDVRGYTTLAESMTPREAFSFINEHLNSVGPLIREHYGLVAQFYGDGVMAIFPRSPADAVRAAVTMQKTVDDRNERRIAEGRPPIQIGIGLNAGPLTIGVIGDGERADTGVVGDTVNSAARMEGLTKTYGVRIVAAGLVLEGLDGEFEKRFLDRVQVRGRRQRVAVYDVFEGDEASRRALKNQTLSTFNAGLEHFEAERYVDALKCFGDVLDVMPDDRATQIYLERCARCLLDPETAS